MSILLDGKHVARLVRLSLAEQVAALLSQGKPAPHLAIILVGNDPASHTYVRHKLKACQEIGVQTTLISQAADTHQENLIQLIQRLNEDATIHGIIVQLPLPMPIVTKEVIQAIFPHKDVDGLHPFNYGSMAYGWCLPTPFLNISLPPTILYQHHTPIWLESNHKNLHIEQPKDAKKSAVGGKYNLITHIPATPLGILMLLAYYQIETTGKHCVIIGRGSTVGSPLSILMSRDTYPGNATVTLCHSHTHDLPSLTRQADILVVAVGKPGLVTADMVQPGAIVIDVGITRVPDSTKKLGYRLQGDVDFEAVSPLCAYITPVPGGIGPMTIAALLSNTVRAATGQSL
jgi:methylenetetrahydrofolate dehydrogenase (NADP+)/methenyltetrahydrofolate cyclohydrolase